MPAASTDEPATAIVESHLEATQGMSYQGINYNGMSYQGMSYQGMSYQGGSYGGLALNDATITGTTLVVWTQRPNGVWDQRFPDKICAWNSTRTTVISCVPLNPATVASPLAGTIWQARFVQSDNSVVEVPVEIGASATAVGAVKADTALAMYALNGTAAASCAPLVAQGSIMADGQRCDAPGGCRASCDVWLYDVRVPGSLDSNGQPLGLCPAGELATALAGTWDATGKFTASTTAFTFACTSGTIAKCTRWGYRPWGTATGSNGTAGIALAPYHQACVRAATADYCADGTSWTRNGTLVDVYDYYPGGDPSAGLIARTRIGVVSRTAASAFAWESSFDVLGAAVIDHTRYMGITDPNPGALECHEFTPVHYSAPPGGGGAISDPFQRDTAIASPLVSIDSTPVCAHSEAMTGTWLHLGCSDCTAAMANYAVIDPVTHIESHPYMRCVQSGQHWDAACVQGAQSVCAGIPRMAPHSECDLGSGIGRFATGCSARLESTINTGTSPPSRPYDHCATNWDSTCVNGANARCTGGLETRGLFGVGFCGQSLRVLTGG